MRGGLGSQAPVFASTPSGEELREGGDIRFPIADLGPSSGVALRAAGLSLSLDVLQGPDTGQLPPLPPSGAQSIFTAITSVISTVL